MELIHTLATNEELRAEAVRLSELRAQTFLTEQRKARITEQMCYLFFELDCRNGVWIDNLSKEAIEQ